MTFADFEPEDAWHPDDAVAELARNLGRRIALVDELPEPRGVSRAAVLGAIAHRLEQAQRRRNLNDRARLRLVQLEQDLAHARSRL